MPARRAGLLRPGLAARRGRLRSVPGQHFRFLWTVFPGTAAAINAWPGAAYVDLVGTDVYDWYGGPDNTYPHTASGQLDHDADRWQEILTQPGALDWIAQLSRLTGKPVAIPEWGLDFHSFGGQDDPAFITRMLAWLHAHHAIGVYWAIQHVASYQAVPPGPLLAGLGAYAGSPAGVNDLGLLLGGRLQYAEAFLPDDQPVSDSSAQPVLAPAAAGYQLILSVPLVPLTVPSYNGPPRAGASVPAGRLPRCAGGVPPGGIRRPPLLHRGDETTFGAPMGITAVTAISSMQASPPDSSNTSRAAARMGPAALSDHAPG